MINDYHLSAAVHRLEVFVHYGTSARGTWLMQSYFFCMEHAAPRFVSNKTKCCAWTTPDKSITMNLLHVHFFNLNLKPTDTNWRLRQRENCWQYILFIAFFIHIKFKWRCSALPLHTIRPIISPTIFIHHFLPWRKYGSYLSGHRIYE